MKYYNSMAPFPVYDTDYVKDVENKIKKIMSDKTKEYDEESVIACRHCNSLHIVSDEIDNDVCFKCGSVNQLKEFKNIYEYKDFIKNKNE